MSLNNALVSYYVACIFENNIFQQILQCHKRQWVEKSRKKLTLCTIAHCANQVQSIFTFNSMYGNNRFTQSCISIFLLAFHAKNDKIEIAQVKISCHMQFSSHYIQQYFNTLKAKKWRLKSKKIGSILSLTKKEQFRASIISVAWLFDSDSLSVCLD